MARANHAWGAWSAEVAVGATSANMIEEWKRKSENIEKAEQIKDEVYFLNDKREVVVETYGMDFDPCHQEASQGSWEQGYRNQGRNFKHVGNLENQEREEPIYSNIEIMLENVLERVTSTNLGVCKLKSELVTLTQTNKSHDISIRDFEERMNQLASQNESGVNGYARGTLVEMVTKNPEYGKCCGD
ncbi:hypothetical protein HAX54_002078 [Datura stramonium]|uniref:Uncharacterized protein n=1 Tax=Datura stramonium TaxID=4076 RepID=A0ABS8T3D2_DATST|nr:hypothetical protein [Datura stramonium]